MNIEDFESISNPIEDVVMNDMFGNDVVYSAKDTFEEVFSVLQTNVELSPLMLAGCAVAGSVAFCAAYEVVMRFMESEIYPRTWIDPVPGCRPCLVPTAGAVVGALSYIFVVYMTSVR